MTSITETFFPICNINQHDDNDILNADTERPDEEDYEISALEDLATQAEL